MVENPEIQHSEDTGILNDIGNQRTYISKGTCRQLTFEIKGNKRILGLYFGYQKPKKYQHD